MQPLSNLSLLVAIALVVSAGETNPLFHLCGSNGNFTSNSTYRRNLNALMVSITSDTAIDQGYYNFSYGQSPDEARATALCRGDINPADCRACINESWHSIMQYCPVQKEATIYSELCTMRYSYILDASQINPTFSMRKVKEIEMHVDEFNHVLVGLLDVLRTRAAAGNSLRKFAVGNVTLTDSATIFSMVQCTPDQSKELCDSCLSVTMLDLLKNCNGTEGCRMVRPSCSIRYEIYCFYDRQDYASPPSPSQLRLPSTSSRYRFDEISSGQAPPPLLPVSPPESVPPSSDLSPTEVSSPPEAPVPSPSIPDSLPPPPAPTEAPPPPAPTEAPPPPPVPSPAPGPSPSLQVQPPSPIIRPPAQPPTIMKVRHSSSSHHRGIKIGVPPAVFLSIIIPLICWFIKYRKSDKAKSMDDTGNAASVHQDIEGTPKSTSAINSEEKKLGESRSRNIINKISCHCLNFGVGSY